MSDEHQSPDKQSTVSNSLSSMLMVGIPLALIVMLAVSGIAFVGGIKGDRGDPVEKKAAAPAPAPVASTETAAAPPSKPKAPSPGAVPEGVDPDQWALGKKTFATCAACHGTNGTGLEVGPSLMAPSLIGSETLLGDPERPILVVLKGIAKESNDFLGMMAALGALPDDQIAAVLTFLRNNWGNQAVPINTEQVAAAREKFSDVVAPAGVSRSQIDAILKAHQ